MIDKDSMIRELENKYRHGSPLERLKICEQISLMFISDVGINTEILDSIKVDISTDEEDRMGDSKSKAKFSVVSRKDKLTGKVEEVLRTAQIKVSCELLKKEIYDVVWELLAEYSHCLYFLIFQDEYDEDKLKNNNEGEKNIRDFALIFREFVFGAPIRFSINEHAEFAMRLMDKNLFDVKSMLDNLLNTIIHQT